MSCSSIVRALGALSLVVSFAATAAQPSSGSLSETEPILNWTGDAPFVVTNVTPASGEPQCVGEPLACDIYALNVNVSDEFRADELNKKERVTFTVAWPNASGAGDFDVYLRDSAGTILADAATSAQPEVIVVPLSVLKNGDYRFEVIPFAPIAENYSAEAMLGKQSKTSPVSGELSETSGPIVFTGGPYFIPTPGGIVAGSGVECEVPTTCDEFALTVNISDEFRMDEANAKEVVQIIMTPSFAEPTLGASADIDLYLLDASGAEVGSSTSATATEAITVPLKVLKNGSYTVRLITGIPLGTSESVEIRLGRGKALESKEGRGLLVGGFGLLSLLGLFGVAAFKRKRA